MLSYTPDEYTLPMPDIPLTLCRRPLELSPTGRPLVTPGGKALWQRVFSPPSSETLLLECTGQIIDLKRGVLKVHLFITTNYLYFLVDNKCRWLSSHGEIACWVRAIRPREVTSGRWWHKTIKLTGRGSGSDHQQQHQGAPNVLQFYGVNGKLHTVYGLELPYEWFCNVYSGVWNSHHHSQIKEEQARKSALFKMQNSMKMDMLLAQQQQMQTGMCRSMSPPGVSCACQRRDSLDAWSVSPLLMATSAASSSSLSSPPPSPATPLRNSFPQSPSTASPLQQPRHNHHSHHHHPSCTCTTGSNNNNNNSNISSNSNNNNNNSSCSNAIHHSHHSSTPHIHPYAYQQQQQQKQLMQKQHRKNSADSYSPLSHSSVLLGPGQTSSSPSSSSLSSSSSSSSPSSSSSSSSSPSPSASTSSSTTEGAHIASVSAAVSSSSSSSSSSFVSPPSSSSNPVCLVTEYAANVPTSTKPPSYPSPGINQTRGSNSNNGSPFCREGKTSPSRTATCLELSSVGGSPTKHAHNANSSIKNPINPNSENNYKNNNCYYCCCTKGPVSPVVARKLSAQPQPFQGTPLTLTLTLTGLSTLGSTSLSYTPSAANTAATSSMSSTQAMAQQQTAAPAMGGGSGDYGSDLSDVPVVGWDAMPLRVAQGTELTFGLGTRQAPVDSELREEVTLVNKTKHRQWFRFHPASGPKCTLSAEPPEGCVGPCSEARVVVSATIHCTTRLRIELPLVVWRRTKSSANNNGEGRQQKQKQRQRQRASLVCEVVSQLSTKLDPDDVVLYAQPLGSGTFGTTYRGTYRYTEVAVKVIKHQGGSAPIPQVLADFRKETTMLEKLRHPCVVGFIGAVHVPGILAIVTELAPYGSLGHVLRSAAAVGYPLRLRALLDTAKGMAYLHRSGIVHRDLKPDNVLVVSLEASSSVVCKLSDFGATRDVNFFSHELVLTRGVGTPAFMAPEILAGRCDYEKSADVYSFAMTMVNVITGRPPFDGCRENMRQRVIEGYRPQLAGTGVPADYLDLMVRCWSGRPDERPGFDFIVERIARMLQSIPMLPSPSSSFAPFA